MTRGKWLSLVGAVILALVSSTALAQEKTEVPEVSGPVFVSAPVVGTLSPAVRDLPDFVPDPDALPLEMKRREDYGFIPVEYNHPPKVDPLLERQMGAGPAPLADTGFATPVHNYAGQASTSSPPDTTGDVGLTYFLQGTNQAVSSVQVINKATGANAKTFTMQSLASSSPCNSGYCDPVVMYDRMADRWVISELPSSGGNVCIYVSTSGDPTGTYYAYTFAVETSLPDYPKYGIWPQGGNAGSYIMGVNHSSTSGYYDIFAFDRAKMLTNQSPTFQKFQVPALANAGFQLVLPSTLQGPNAPPAGEPAIFARPHDDENADSPAGNTPSADWIDLWALTVNWTTPASSTLTKLTNVSIADYDMTLCGMGNTWNCMPQPGTTQKIDPIREPLHYPFQYRNFGDHQSLVGTFVEDVDGTDHAALRWFELRKPVGSGSWTLYQEGLIGGESGVHRSVGTIAMDGSGNLAIGYTRTGTAAPYYPSIYYKGRLSSDTLGTMPQGEYALQTGSFSKTGDERWGDYAGIGIDPSDDCTFWFTTEYMTSSSNCGTRVGAVKFTACGCLSVPAAPTAGISVPQNNRITVTWNDSATATIAQYLVSRSTTTGGPYTQIAAINDTSPGVGGGAGYSYNDDTVSGGTRYYYIVKSTDGISCTSAASGEVNALATGVCTLSPTFAGLTSVTNPSASTCTLNLAWSAGTSGCSGTLTYNIYRGTSSGFTPAAGNRIASGVSGTSYSDVAGLISGTTYYYVVRALDSVNAAEDTNAVEKSGAPYGSGSGSATLLTESFDSTTFPPTGWTQVDVSGTAGNWARSTATVHPTGGTPHSGAGLAYFNSYTATSGATTRLYRSSSTAIPGTVTSAAVNFYLYHDTGYTTYADQIQVQVSTNGTTWTNVGTAVNRYDGSTGWKAHSIDFTAYKGQSVYIGLLGVSAYGNDCHVDDVTLTTVTLASCTTASAGPKPVPDGRLGGTAMKGTRVTTDGASISVTYDTATCSVADHTLLYGNLANVSAMTLSGSVCSIGNASPYSWTSVPTGYNVFWVIVGDGGTTESSWGQKYTGGVYSERSATASNQCGNTALDTTGTCP